MERNIITFFLAACLTLGFFSFISSYLPAKGARSPNQLTVSAESVTLTEVLEQIPSPAIPYWMEEANPDLATAKVHQPSKPGESIPDDRYPLKPYSPLPALLRTTYPPLFEPALSLLPMVEFWRNVYANYDLHHTILHDNRDLTIVYGVLDFEGFENTGLRSRIESIKKARLQAMLLGFSRGEKPETAGEQLVYRLFEPNAGRHKFEEAADRIRGQWGQKSRFQEGLIRSGRYLPMIEAIFESQGIPKEVAKLVFVESMFVPRARSKAGAAGPWQFMPRTARLNGLVMNQTIDERDDPLIAAQAAARLLRKDYERVESWPLAINAYNTGVFRMVRAVNQLRTKRIDVIIRHFEDRTYQFASRNFYPEFLAALEAVKNYPRYFGELLLDEPIPFDELPLAYPTSPYQLALKSGMDLEVLKDLNPAYQETVFQKEGWIPEGYVIRVPHQQKELFASWVEAIHTAQKLARRYVVQRGDTLHQIANRHRVALSELQSLNGLLGHRIFPGQTLKIPGSSRTVMLGE